MANSASAADPYLVQMQMMQQRRQQPQQLQHHVGHWVGGLEQWDAREGCNAMEPDSLGDLSVLKSVEPSVTTPSQLRDSDHWSAHAPPTDDDAPQYEYPNLSCGVTHAS